jgi:hypothetical protein
MQTSEPCREFNGALYAVRPIAHRPHKRVAASLSCCTALQQCCFATGALQQPCRTALRCKVSLCRCLVCAWAEAR